MSMKLLATALGICLALSAFLIRLPGDTPEASSSTRPPPTSTGARPASEGKAAPGELLVRFASTAAARDRSRLREEADTDIKRKLPLPGLQLLHVERGQSVGQAVAELERSRDVVYAEPNFRRSATVIPNDSYFGDQWGLNNTGQSLGGGSAGTADADIDAPEAWDITTASPDVTVAVVDTGLDVTHPDLSGNVWTNPGEQGNGRDTNGIDDDGNGYRDDWRGWDWVGSDNLPSDANGHGTHVAGTVAARGNDGAGVAGVAWRSHVMPLRVLDANGSGTVADAVSAYRYAAAKGAKVVNASLGGDSYSQTEADAIAESPGTLFVVAAGNGGGDGVGDSNDVTPEYPCGYPARSLVCVAASDRRDALAPFSNYGASTVDLAAPGVDILSTLPGKRFDFFNGTSMATPHVAGAAALLFAIPASTTTGPSVEAVESALLGGAEAKPAFIERTLTGGRLNVDRSLMILDPDAAVQPAPAPASEPAPAPAPAPTPTPALAIAPALTGDDTPPGLSLAVRRRQRLKLVLLRGLRARIACSEGCRLSARVLVGVRDARRLGLTRTRRAATVGRASSSLTAAGATGRTLRIRLSAQARRKLRRSRGLRLSIRIVARDAAGNARRLDRRVTLVR